MGILSELDSKLVNIAPQCRVCGDSGKIIVYRNDWESFDEIDCKNCNISTT